MSAPLRLVVKCCACGVEQTSFEVPLDDEIVRPEVWWTRRPCPPCFVQLAGEEIERAYHQGGEDAVSGLKALGEAGIPINVVTLAAEQMRS